MRARIVTCCLVMLATANPAWAQDGGQVELRGEIVEIRAVVTDKQGRLRDDLAREDFEVLENGEPREVAFFSVERAGAAPAAPAPGAVPAPAGAPPAAAGARTIVLFVDAVNLTAADVGRAKKQLVE